MPPISRREFIKMSSSSAVAGALLATGSRILHANPLGLPIGCQTWPVREMIAKDFRGTLKELAAAGFQTIELCSPVGYADSGFAGLSKFKGSELRSILHEEGLTCVSSHFSMDELRKNQDDRISWAKDLGLTQMLVPSLDGPKNPTLDDVKRAADEYNRMGERAAQAGIVQGLHNEDFELTKVDGKRTYDLLFQLLDPKFVKFQFQVSTISDGYDAARVLYQISRPLYFHACSGLVSKDPQDRAGRPGHSGLEQNIRRGQDRRHQKLLRRDGLAVNEGQRSLSSPFAGGIKRPSLPFAIK